MDDSAMMIGYSEPPTPLLKMSKEDFERLGWEYEPLKKGNGTPTFAASYGQMGKGLIYVNRSRSYLGFELPANKVTDVTLAKLKDILDEAQASDVVSQESVSENVESSESSTGTTQSES